MENKTAEKSKSSRKKKTLSLCDFIVAKPQKSEKSSSNKKIAKKVPIASVYVKRGKVKKKKPTTLKKKILKIRNGKSAGVDDDDESESQSDALHDDQSPDEVVSDHQQVAGEPEVMNIVDKLATISVKDEAKQTQIDVMPSINETVVVAAPGSVQHSRNFRDYCNHFITNELRSLTCEILESLLKFQENKFHENPSESSSSLSSW